MELPSFGFNRVGVGLQTKQKKTNYYAVDDVILSAM